MSCASRNGIDEGFTALHLTSHEAPDVMTAGLFSGAIGFLHKMKLQSTPGGVGEWGGECCLMSLRVDILDSAGNSLGCHHLGGSFLVSSSAPTTLPPPPCAGTVIAKSGGSLVQILQRLTTWCPLRREVPDYMAKFAMTRTSVNPTVWEPSLPPPPTMPVLPIPQPSRILG